MEFFSGKRVGNLLCFFKTVDLKESIFYLLVAYTFFVELPLTIEKIDEATGAEEEPVRER